jgi:hypothetical protein
MDRREAGKQKAEQFVRDLVKGLAQDGLVSALLWWSGGPAAPGGAGSPGEAAVVLRMYRGNSWRAIEFAASDIDGSIEKPELLQKYASDVTQNLTEL